MSNKQYELEFKIGADLQASFRQVFGTTIQSLGDLESELRKVARSDAFKQMQRDAEHAERTIDDMNTQVEGFGATLGRVTEYASAFAVVQGTAQSIMGIVTAVDQFDESLVNVQAATGLTKAEMTEIEAITKSLYATPLGENFTDLADSITMVKQITKQSGDQLQETTQNAILFRDVFKLEIPASVKTTDTMVKNFGITSEQAFNLLAQGAQQGLDKSGELLDSANEYAPQFAALGFSANQMFDIFSAGLESGAFNLDKVGDAVKEFNIRAKDGSKSTAEGFKLLGMNAKQMTKIFASGGDQAQESFKQVVLALSDIEDPVKRNAAGVNLFGSQFEDLEKNVISAMGTAQSQFDMTKATMDEIATIKLSTVSAEYKELGRMLMNELVLPMAHELLPVLKQTATWLIENEEIAKSLAVAIPGIMIARQTTLMVRGLTAATAAAGEVAGGATTASRAVGLLGSAAGLLATPVGLGVAAVAALTAGVMLYQRHQEAARQALIHMSDELQTASKEYQEVAKNADETAKLTNEYKQLSDKIATNTDHYKDLTAEKTRLKAIEQQLQDIHPDIISQYDIENGKIREKIGLIEQESQADKELARLKLEKQVAEKQNKLPKLEQEINSLGKQSQEIEKNKQAYDEAIPTLKQYAIEIDKLLKQPQSADRTAQLDEMLKKVNEVGATLGDGSFNLSYNAQLESLSSLIDRVATNRIGVIDSTITNSEELKAAQKTYEELYKTQKQVIELNLGGTIEDQTSKFSQLSGAQQQRFMEALDMLKNLNAEMDMLPYDRKVNVDVIYRQIGDVSQLAKQLMASGTLGMKGYADGGIVSKPTVAMIGEGGSEEIIVPINNKPRSHALLNAANQMMGRQDSGNHVSVNYSPVITVQGNADKAQIQQALRESQDEFVRKFELMLRERARVAI